MSNAIEKFAEEAIVRMGGVRREPQMQMINRVVTAVMNGEPVIIEAPTGTGKSFGYSLPAIVFAYKMGKRVLIVTRTKKLQDQLAKDLPRYIAAVLQDKAGSIKWSKLKGRNHFTCANRIAKSDTIPSSLITWVGEGGGSRDDAPHHTQGEWTEVAGGDDCVGKKCKFFADCLGTKVRMAAEQADIVIANQKLLAMNATGIRAIPGDFDIIIVDEAQHFEDTLREELATTLTPAMLSKATFADCADELQRVLPKKDYVFSEGIDPHSIFYDTYVAAIEQAKKLSNKIKNSSDPDLQDKKDLNRMIKISDALWAFTKPEENILWLDPEGMHSSPVDVREIIREEFGSMATVLTSATIPNDFGLGIPIVNIGGGFTNAGMFVSPDHNGGGAYAFRPGAAEDTVRMIRAMNGRTLALYTSERAMMDMYYYLTAQDLGVPVYHQKLPNAIERFKDEEHAVLLGIETCWEGIDVPGQSLSLVIIDRIPFPNLKDPIYEAKVQREGWFGPSVGPAKTLFRQGCGRLLRTGDDVGVIAVLDNRLLTKGYGKVFINAIDAQRIDTLDEACQFLEAMAEEYDGVTAQ